MLKKRRVLLIFIVIIFTCGHIWAEVPVIELDTEVITEIKLQRSLLGYKGAGDIAFIDDWDIIEINTTTLVQRRLNEKTEFGSIKGSYDDDLIVIRVDREKESNRVSYYRYNAETENYIPIPEIDQDELALKAGGGRIGLKRIFHYYDNKYFIVFTGEDLWSSYLYDTETDEMELLFYKEIIDISPDKLHLMIRGNNDKLEIDNFSEKSIVIDGTQLKDKNPGYFLSNDIIIVNRYKYTSLLNIYGIEALQIKYSAAKNNESKTFRHRISNSNYILLREEGSKTIYGWYLGRTLGETESLNSLGLLFHPTSGIANDSRVRIREWPLLDAENLGYLTKGDKLEILDRSGIKVKIGNMEDYWYKLRRPSDGMEGWSYGEFIDIDGE